MDTIGKSLVTSGFLVDQYFQSANRLVETRLGKPAMEPKDWKFNSHFLQYEELSGSHKSAFNYRYLNLYEQPNSDTRQGGYGHIEDFKQGRARLRPLRHRSRGHGDASRHALRSRHLRHRLLRALHPRRRAGDVTKGHIHYPQPIEPLLASAVVPDNTPTGSNSACGSKQGQTPRFIFPNGPYESRASVVTINKRYKDEFKGDVGKSGVGRAHILKEGKLPHIRISEIKIHGPVPKNPAASRKWPFSAKTASRRPCARSIECLR
jgi:hypothetical protein